MIKRLFAYLLPLWMVLALFGFECLTSGVDLSVRRVADQIQVGVTNNTYWYCRFEWSADLQEWHHYKTVFGEPSEPVARSVWFTIKTNEMNQVFWRLVDRPLP
jgi:hypothetical protein